MIASIYFVYTIIALLACAAAWAGFRWYRSRSSEIDSIQFLVKQAEGKKWKKVLEVTEDGLGASWVKRRVHFVRDKEEAVLWHADATVTLVRDYAPPTFNDFIELERWIKKNPRDLEIDRATGEKLYRREIERFVTKHGYFLPLLETTATDVAFFNAVHSFNRAGYVGGESPVVVAALTLDALMSYQKDRDLALRFLAGLEKDIGDPVANNLEAFKSPAE